MDVLGIALDTLGGMWEGPTVCATPGTLVRCLTHGLVQVSMVSLDRLWRARPGPPGLCPLQITFCLSVLNRWLLPSV